MHVGDEHLEHLLLKSHNPTPHFLPFPSCLQIWSLGSSTPNFTLEGHEKGVNCVDYYYGGDKPYLVTGADDK